MIHRVEITKHNKDLAKLQLHWVRPEFSADDGIGPLESLYQVGDYVAAVAGVFDNQLSSIGSGVMVAPGIMLTATHVLDEFPRDGSGPILLTFLPDGNARAWLPTTSVTCSGKSKLQLFDKKRRIVSDLSVVSCTLNSEAHCKHPLCLPPIELCLPILGSRLWAVGFRQGAIGGSEEIEATPFVTSGIVTACFPEGRGERMPSPCIEVAMESVGGMSGGPVFNADGRLVGVISTSLDAGPTYITLVWDALRLSIEGLPKEVWKEQESNLVKGVDLGLVRIKGNFKYDENRNTVLTLSEDEMHAFMSSK